jgi:hypothetical protein
VVGDGHVDLLGEGPLGLLDEAEGDLVLAGVRTAVPTLLTGPVAEVERNRDVVALVDVLDAFADLDDRPGRFVAQDLAGLGLDAEPAPVALPAVPVAATDATRL